MRIPTEEYQAKLDILLSKLPKDPASSIYRFFTTASNIKNLGLWTSAVTAGFVAVGFALTFRMLEKGFRSWLTHNDSYFLFLVVPLFFLLAWWVVYRFAPPAAGSGIPQIMAANELNYESDDRRTVDRLLSLKTAFIKVISSLLCVCGGGAIGREGPTLQISTSVFHFFGTQIRRFFPETKEQTWIVAGAAAGLASAFNTPLGGIVYAIEELGITHFHRIRTSLISAVIVSGLVAQWILGGYLYLGFPSLQDIGFRFLPWALLTGVASGVLGGIFGRTLFALASARTRIKNGRTLAILTVLCGISTASLIFLDHRSSGSGVDVINGFLFHNESADFTLVTFRFLATTFSYLSGAAGGIFSPSLAVGGAFGSFLASVLPTNHAHLMVLLGMIGFLTGVTRTPFTAFILVLEMTDRHSAIFPMMMSALVAQWAAHLIDSNSFYEHIKLNYLPQKRVIPEGTPLH